MTSNYTAAFQDIDKSVGEISCSMAAKQVLYLVSKRISFLLLFCFKENWLHRSVRFILAPSKPTGDLWFSLSHNYNN